MITFIFLAIFGTIIVGFVLYLSFFKDNAGKGGRPGPTEQTRQQPSKGRALGPD